MTLGKLGAALALAVSTSAFAQTTPGTLPVPDEATIPAGPAAIPGVIPGALRRIGHTP